MQYNYVATPPTTKKLIIPGHIGWEDSNDTLVVVNMDGGETATLQNSARDIWLTIAKLNSIDGIYETLSQRYEIPINTAKHDCDSFIQELLTAGFIQYA